MNNKKIYEEQRNIENIKKNIETPEKIRKEINYKFSLIIFIPLALVFLIAIGVIIFFVFRETQQLEILETKMRPPDPEVYSAASPFPFQELTIPYLRAKDYESSLSDLEQISSNSEYTSYLTSYVSDGFRINGLLTKPSGEAPEGGFPAIIFVMLLSEVLLQSKIFQLLLFGQVLSIHTKIGRNLGLTIIVTDHRKCHQRDKESVKSYLPLMENSIVAVNFGKW